MRKPMLRITGIFSISLVILGLNLAAGPIEGTASISGTVRDEKGSPFDGILVRLINTDRNVTVSVITQSGGRYAADSLFSGTYEVRAERQGWKTAIKQGVRVVNRAAVDLVLNKQQVKPGHLTLEDLPGQFPEDPDRALVMNTCFQCHGMEAVFHRRKDRAGWEATIRRMAPNRGRTEEEINRLVNYFEKHFNTNRPVALPFATEPLASTEEPNVRITEYKIPDPGTPREMQPAYGGSSGNTAPAYPHNITVTPEGIVWFAMYRGNGIGRLDPRTGEFRNYPVPTPGSVPHGIEWALDGSIWFTEASASKVGRLDPETGEILEFPLCGGNSIVKDSRGNMYLTCSRTHQIGKVNTKTYETKEYDLLTPRALPYGITVDQKDQVWWCQRDVDKIGMLDPTTEKITEYPTPELSAPRRIDVDSKGNIWFTYWAASKVAKLDPTTGEITEYVLPTSNSDPYEVMVEADDTVWVAGFQSNTLAHLDPDTGKFVEYPIPTGNAQIRKMYADPKYGMWFAESYTDVIGHVMVKH